MLKKINPQINSIKPDAQKKNRQLKVPADKYIPDQFKKVATSMESQFIDLMIKQMRKSVDSAEKKSASNEIYSSMQDAERSKIMANTRGGVGLKEIVLNQIYPKRFRNKFAYENYQRQQAQANEQIIKHNSEQKKSPIVIHEQEGSKL